MCPKIAFHPNQDFEILFRKVNILLLGIQLLQTPQTRFSPHNSVPELHAYELIRLKELSRLIR